MTYIPRATFSDSRYRQVSRNEYRAKKSNAAQSQVALPPSGFLSSFVAQGVMETFGPTGSGADNIWNTLDFLPANTTSLYIRFLSDLLVAPNNYGTYSIYAADGDQPTLTQGNDSEIYRARMSADSGNVGNVWIGAHFTFWVPVNAANVFWMGWNRTNSVGAGGGIPYLEGFILDQ